MNRLLRDLPVFVEVAKNKSFTKAADALDMPLSTVSRRILALEKELGNALFHRSSRKVELTEAGARFFERCSYIMSEAETAWEEMTVNMKSPKGRVRIAAAGDIYHAYLMGSLGSFARQWPEIELQVMLSQHWVDLHTEPYDLDIRAGVLPESNFIVRKLAVLKPYLYASPRIFDFFPMPEKPEDLAKLPCISYAQHPTHWTMRKDGIEASVTVKPRHVTSSPSLCLELTLADQGVSWFITHMADPYVESGELVPLLPGWYVPDVEISIIMPSRQLPRRVRLFVEHLADYFAKVVQAGAVQHPGSK